MGLRSSRRSCKYIQVRSGWQLSLMPLLTHCISGVFVQSQSRHFWRDLLWLPQRTSVLIRAALAQRRVLPARHQRLYYCLAAHHVLLEGCAYHQVPSNMSTRCADLLCT